MSKIFLNTTGDEQEGTDNANAADLSEDAQPKKEDEDLTDFEGLEETTELDETPGLDDDSKVSQEDIY